jgi:hypothetical protein
MKTNLRTAPHYFIIDSIGGMNEGYSDTTCRRVEDVVTPELGKALVEEYIDQWIHDIHKHWESEYGINVKFGHDECEYGGWHRVYVFADEFPPDMADVDINEGHTLFIQVYDGVMLGDGVVVYDQMDDMVRTITNKSTAIRMAEEGISLEVNRLKQALYEEETDPKLYTYYTNSLIFCYDCLAEVVRSLEYPQDTMVDIDDSCTHYFPTQNCKRLVWLNGSRIQTETQYA